MARAGCMRSVPLGMTDGRIQDWQISASSTTPADWDPGCHERFARLYEDRRRAWCAKYKAPSEWLQIDLGVAAKVRAQLPSSCIFTARDATLAWCMPSSRALPSVRPSVTSQFALFIAILCLSVRLSVCHTRGCCWWLFSVTGLTPFYSYRFHSPLFYHVHLVVTRLRFINHY